MLDRDTKNKIKKIANAMSDFCVSNIDEFGNGNKLLIDSNINYAEFFLIVRLTEIYSAVKMGELSKEEAKERQKQLFDTVEFEE
ncbi:MAG: hypothetical protein ACI4A5_11945 [Hominilimicola sp.]